MTYDLQIAGGGNLKQRTVNVGDDIVVNIYAVVQGTDTDTSNDGFQFGYGSVLNSSTGASVAGNVTASSLGAGFTAYGSSKGKIGNADGGLGGDDLGGATTTTSPSSNTYFKAQSTAPSNTYIVNGGKTQMVTTSNASSLGVTYQTQADGKTTQFLIGTVTYHVSSAATTGGAATLNFAAPTFTSVFARNSLFAVDGNLRNDLTLASAAIVSNTSATGVSFSGGVADAYFNNTAHTSDTSWSRDVQGTYLSHALDTNFSSDANSAVTTTLPGSLTTVHFNGTSISANGGGALSTDLGRDFSVKGLTFDGSANQSVTVGSAGNFTLTLGSGGISVASGSAAHTISAKVALGVDQTWTVDSSNPLTVSGVISGAGKNLTKAGTGTLIVSGANTYSGTTTIDAGKIDVQGSSSLSSTSRVTVNSTGTLQLSASGGVSASATPITLAGGTLAIGSAASHSVGLLTLTSDSTLDLTGDGGNSILTLAGVTAWTGSSELTITGWSGTYGGGVSGNDHIYFTSTSGIDLSHIRFDAGGGNYFGAEIIGGNELVAIPEPAAVAAALLLLGTVGWRERRRLAGFGASRSRALQPVRLA